MNKLPEAPTSKAVNFHSWSEELREGWGNNFLDTYLPKGCKAVGVIVSGGQVVERIYKTPTKDIISIKMEHKRITSKIPSSLLFSNNVD